MEIKGFVEAVSEKEIDTKLGKSTKVGIKVGETWINGWGKTVAEKGDYVVAEVEQNKYGYQIKSIRKETAPVEEKNRADSTSERIARSTSLAQANATIQINGSKNVSEEKVLDLAEKYFKWIMTGQRGEFIVTEDVVVSSSIAEFKKKLACEVEKDDVKA